MREDMLLIRTINIDEGVAFIDFKGGSIVLVVVVVGWMDDAVHVQIFFVRQSKRGLEIVHREKTKIIY